MLESKDKVVDSLKRVVVVERTGLMLVVLVFKGLEVIVLVVFVKEGRVELMSGRSSLIYCPSQSLYEETRV